MNREKIEEILDLRSSQAARQRTVNAPIGGSNPSCAANNDYGKSNNG